MGELDDLPDLGHILLVGQAGSIDHDASAAGGNRRLYLVDILMMIQMEGHRDVVLLHDDVLSFIVSGIEYPAVYLLLCLHVLSRCLGVVLLVLLGVGENKGGNDILLIFVE